MCSTKLQERAGALRAPALQLRSRDIRHKNDMIKGVMSDQNRGQMSSGVLKASDRQRNFIKREISTAPFSFTFMPFSPSWMYLYVSKLKINLSTRNGLFRRFPLVQIASKVKEFKFFNTKISSTVATERGSGSLGQHGRREGAK
jgi:hypothetical protein